MCVYIYIYATEYRVLHHPTTPRHHIYTMFTIIFLMRNLISHKKTCIKQNKTEKTEFSVWSKL